MLPSFCEREGQAGRQAGVDLGLELGQALEVGPGGGGRGAQRLRGAEPMLGDRRELFPAALAHEVALTLGEHDQVGPGLGHGAHPLVAPESAISAQASRSSVSSSETSSILAGFCSIEASIRCLRQKA